MKCNQCGNENADNSAFCARCGAQLQPTTQMATPVSASTTPLPGGAVTSAPSNFTNLNPSVQPQKKPAHLIMIIGCIAGVLSLTIIAILIVWFISSRSGGKEILSCSKDSKAVTQSVALTYDKKTLTKMEYTYIIDKTINKDDLRASDAEELMVATFAAMAFAQYDGHDGIEYSHSEKTTITTVSLTADLTKMNKADAAELVEDAKDLSLDETKSKFMSEGFTCTVK